MYKLIAAIDVGSYELEMKIYELSPKKGITMINHVRHIIEIGKDTYIMVRSISNISMRYAKSFIILQRL